MTLDKKELPLRGMIVLEFCSIAAGPFCGMLLADMGAEVIKIEPPEGDALRSWPPITDGFSENFASLNRNKQSVALNLKNPEDLKIARELARSASVVVENNRPGVMDRLGLGFAELHKLNPKLLYCSISAFGQTGPRAAEGGFDLTIQAAAGVMSVTGAGDEPVKCGVPIADFASGLYAAFAIASAAVDVRSGGIGRHIDIPMYGCTLAIAALQTSEYFGTGKSPRKLGSAHPRNAPYQAYRAADGYFAIAAGNDRLWRAVTQVVELEQLTQDPRFLTTTARAENQVVLAELLTEKFVVQSVAHWLEKFNAAGVPHAPINDYAQALADPQVAHMDWLQNITLPNGHVTRTFGSPIRIDGKSLPIYHNPSALNADRSMVSAPDLAESE